MHNRFLRGAPVFHTRDPSGTVLFYKDILGFEVDYDDGYYIVMQRGNCAVHLVKDDREISGVHLFLLVEDVDSYYIEVVERGANIERELDDQPYGLREFSLLDINGTEIIFGQEKIDAEAGATNSRIEQKNINLVGDYIKGCNNADNDLLLKVLSSDAIHYFSPHTFEPIRGAANIAQMWLEAQSVEPHWTIDNTVASDNQVVVEYTNSFKNGAATPGQEVLSRGCEWYQIRDGKIMEIRAYFDSDFSHDTGLTGFPYRERGYTVKGNGQ